MEGFIMCFKRTFLVMFMMVSISGLPTGHAQTEPILSERLKDLHDALLEAEINGNEVTVFLPEAQMATVIGISVMGRVRSLFSGAGQQQVTLLQNIKQIEIMNDDALPRRERLLKLGFSHYKTGGFFGGREYFLMSDRSGKYFLSLSPLGEFLFRIKHCVGRPGFMKDNCFELLKHYSSVFGEESVIELDSRQGQVGLLEEIRNIQSDNFNPHGVPRDRRVKTPQTRPTNTPPTQRAHSTTFHRIGRATPPQPAQKVTQRASRIFSRKAIAGLFGVGYLILTEVSAFGWEFLQSRNVEEEPHIEGIKVNIDTYERLRDGLAELIPLLSNSEINDALGIRESNTHYDWQANPVNGIPPDLRIPPHQR